MEYLAIEIVLLLITLWAHTHFKIKLFNSKNHLAIYWGFIFAIGLIWDYFAVFRGHWLYPGKGLIGVFIGSLPIEDYFFILVVTYLILVAYKVSIKLSKKR